MATQNQLTKKFLFDLKKLTKAVGVKSDVAIKRIAFDAYARITERTPVLTGYARASWTINKNSAREANLKKSQFPDGKDNTAKAKNANNKEADNISLEIAKRYYITNDLPYIQSLENGSSPQMDKGYMISRTIKDLNNDAARIIKKVLG